jgi:hypothetical protein
MDMTDDPRDGGTWTGSYTVGRVVFNGSPEPVRHLHGELTVNGEKFNLCRECGSAIKDDILCKRCKRLFEHENEINDLRLELITRNDEIAALESALRELIKAVRWTLAVFTAKDAPGRADLEDECDKASKALGEGAP